MLLWGGTGSRAGGRHAAWVRPFCMARPRTWPECDGPPQRPDRRPIQLPSVPPASGRLASIPGRTAPPGTAARPLPRSHVRPLPGGELQIPALHQEPCLLHRSPHLRAHVAVRVPFDHRVGVRAVDVTRDLAHRPPCGQPLHRRQQVTVARPPPRRGGSPTASFRAACSRVTNSRDSTKRSCCASTRRRDRTRRRAPAGTVPSRRGRALRTR